MYEWKIDAAGPTVEVIDRVTAMNYPRFVQQETKPIVMKAQGGNATRVRAGLVDVEYHPSDVDRRDFDRVRAMVLSELEDITTPFASVSARYVDNPTHAGGYSLQLSVSALDTLDAPAEEPPLEG